MANYNELFSKEVCHCGKKGEYIVSVNTKIIGYACEEHKPNK